MRGCFVNGEKYELCWYEKQERGIAEERRVHLVTDQCINRYNLLILTPHIPKKWLVLYEFKINLQQNKIL